MRIHDNYKTSYKLQHIQCVYRAIHMISHTIQDKCSHARLVLEPNCKWKGSLVGNIVNDKLHTYRESEFCLNKLCLR